MQQQQMTNYPAGATAPTLVYMPVPIRSTTYDRYQYKQSTGLGIALILIGILCIIFNSVCMGVTSTDFDYSGVAYIGHGIWCGTLFIITGSFGVGAGYKKTRCQIVTFMVMCIISAITTISLLTIGIIGACDAAQHCDYNYNYYGYYPNYPYYYAPCEKMSSHDVIVAMEAMMAILGFIAGVLCLWGSALCCGSGVCCCSQPTQFIAQQQPGVYPNNGQIVYLNQSQTGQYLYQTQSPPYSQGYQGMMAPPYVAHYAQPTWTVPQQMNINNSNDPFVGQGPPPQYPATLQVSSAPGQPPTDERKF